MIFVFDLGNVVIRLDYQKIIDCWQTVIGETARDVVNGFKVDEEYEKFEKGQMDSIDYWKHFCSVHKCDLDFDEFNYGWCALYDGYMPGILESIKTLSENNRVVVLTNTNKLHVNVWARMYPEIFDIFDKVYLSSEIGLRKPEKECFEHILKNENGSPDSVIFFDDTLEHVLGAKNVGINGVHVKNEETVKKYLSGKFL
jgi:putative hydrolase of the HAD superfamily